VTPAQLVTLLAALATAALCAGVTKPLLRWLPEPAAPDEIRYRSLTTPGFVSACTLCSAVAAATAWAVLPVALQPLWSVLAVCGVLLAAIDCLTTWLPLRLMQFSWAAMAVAALTGASLAGSWTMLLRAVVGAAAAGSLYYLVWLTSRGGFGFGDVRFAPLLGAAAAAGSWQLLVWTLVAGTLIGGLHGLVRLLTRRRGGFPYTPSMLGGAYLAVLLQALLR